MLVDYPSQSIHENETPHICDHYEMENMLNMALNTGYEEAALLNFKLHADLTINLNLHATGRHCHSVLRFLDRTLKWFLLSNLRFL